MNKEFFKRNRTNLGEKIEDNSLVILFSGSAPKKTADEAYQFTPNRNFYYLTGINEENDILVIKKVNGEIEDNLYLKNIDVEMERWIGKSLRDYEAKEISGVHQAKYKSSFENDIHAFIYKNEISTIYLDLERDSFSQTETISEAFAKILKDKYPQIIIKNVHEKIAELRQIKSKEEIDEIQKAIDITIEGVEELMKNCQGNMKEYELEAYFDFTLKRRGVKDFAFKTIAASGKNATILHYVDNNTEMKDKDLVLFDLGAQVNYYNADITRTFPVGGKFSKRQKEIYEAVLRVNEQVISMIKPGIGFIELNDMAKNLIADECISLGLIEHKEDVVKYYWHSIGHSLGLDTHDVGKRNFIFKEGMVFTVEPGIYVEEEGIGVRIEDDVLVTSKGCDILTKKMIKSVEEIEKFMEKIKK